MAPTIKQRTIGMVGAAIGRLTQMTPMSPEVARAMPDSKGGETPLDLQRYRTDGYELFTTTLGKSVLFYSADQWVRIKLTLETAGNVAIGIGRSDILPVLSGKGRLLTTDEEWEVYVPKGARCYYAATSVNRVATTIEPIPWMEQISSEIRQVATGVLSTGKALIAAFLGQQIPVTSGPAPSLPKALQRTTKLSQLTKMESPGKVL